MTVRDVERVAGWGTWYESGCMRAFADRTQDRVTPEVWARVNAELTDPMLEWMDDAVGALSMAADGRREHI